MHISTEVARTSRIVLLHIRTKMATVYVGREDGYLRSRAANGQVRSHPVDTPITLRGEVERDQNSVPPRTNDELTIHDNVGDAVDYTVKELRDDNGKVMNFLWRYLLVILLALSLIIGVIMGIGLKAYDLTPRQQMYLAFPGDLLIRMLKIVIIPLVTSSLIAGIANLPSKATGTMGLVTTVYFIMTTIIAVVIGLILVSAWRPGYQGNRQDIDNRPLKHKDGGTVSDSVLDLVRNIFPDNLVKACFTIEVTKIKNDTEETVAAPFYMTASPQFTNQSGNSTSSPYTTTNTPKSYSDLDRKPVIHSEPGMNTLGLLVFSIVFGIVLGQTGEVGRPVVVFFQGVMVTMVKIVMLIIWYSPIGIIFMLASRIVNMASPVDEFTRLGHYTGCVLIGLACHAFIIQPLAYFIFLRKNPFFHMFHCLQALLTALATASSSATLPVTMHCLEDVAKVNKYVVRFVAPVGATVNMDGTAIYQVVAVVFIGQSTNEEITVATVIIIGFTGILASIATAGVPEGDIFTMLMILQAAQFDIDGWKLIYAVDWFLDRCRTSTNVWGDCVCSRIVEKFADKKLQEHEEEPIETQTVRVSFV